MVDVKNKVNRKANGREIKSKLLHSLCGQNVDVVSQDGDYSGKLIFEGESQGRNVGFYVDGRHISIPSVHLIYPDQHRIELYPRREAIQ